MYSSASSPAAVHPDAQNTMRIWVLVAIVFVLFSLLLIGMAIHFFYDEGSQASMGSEINPVACSEGVPTAAVLGAAAGPVGTDPGSLQVQVEAMLPITELEAVCGDTRVRAPVANGSANLEGIPSGMCQLYFKPQIAVYQGELTGTSLQCTVASSGGGVICE